MTADHGHSAERVTLARLPSGVEVSTTVHVYEGAEPGKTVYVQAAQHGREINGTEVLRRLHNRLDPAAMAGRLIAVPVADPLTFDRVSYTTPPSIDSVNPNMNRVWPGDADGTVHERMAATLWEHAGDADAIVDLHTGSPDLLTHVVFTEGSIASRDLAEAFGTELLLAEPAGEDVSEEWHDRGFAGKLRVAASRTAIPAITPELAHNRQFVEPAIDTGVMGMLNVFRQLGVLEGSPVRSSDQRIARNHLGRVNADHGGLFRPDDGIELGQTIDRGVTVGAVYDPTTYERLQTVETTTEGVLYAITREATVNAGDRLVSVAVDRD